MKHLKIKLSVLALACLGAGALALQPASIDALAQYEGITVKTHESITMENGAAVSLNVTGDNGKGFSGIRWTTTVDSVWYGKQEPEEQATFVFGTLVVPTALLEGQELTHKLIDTLVDQNNDSLVLDLRAEGFAPTAENENFYTIINYDEIVENYADDLSDEEKKAVLEDVYGLELTARSYIHVTEKPNVYYYVDMTGIDTSRSARYVALAAELDGELNKYRESTDANELAKAQKGAQYYGYGADAEDYYKDFVVSNGAAGTQYIDLEAVAKAAQDFGVSNFAVVADGYTIDEVFVGAKSVPFTHENNTLTLNLGKGQELPTGETYVTAYAKNEEGDVAVYTKPIIGATKVLTKADDLTMFNAKGGYYDSSTKATLWDNGDYWRPEQEQSGYYVLGGDIDATRYVHGSKIADDIATIAPTSAAGKDEELGTDDDINPGDFNNSTWNGADEYVNKPIGLTGTFNGMGYTIDGMTIGSQREGFFGIVNGGTVKNVAFVDVQATGAYKTVIANYLIGATIENVYVKTDEYVADANGDGVAESMGFPMKNCALVSSYATSNSRLKSCLFEYSASSASGDSNMPTGILFYAYGNSYKFTFEDVYCVSNNAVGPSSHLLIYLTKITDKEKKKDNWQELYKKIALAENEAGLAANVSGVDQPTGEGDLKITLHANTTYPRVYWKGVYRYNTLSDMVNNNKTYTNLANTGCWYLDGSNNLVWGQNPNA